MKTCYGSGCLIRSTCKRYVSMDLPADMLTMYSPSHGCKYYMATKIEPVIVDMPIEAIVCPCCNGKGVVDSGGSTPWDEPIDIPCSCCLGRRMVTEQELIKQGWVKDDEEI